MLLPDSHVGDEQKPWGAWALCLGLAQVPCVQSKAFSPSHAACYPAPLCPPHEREYLTATPASPQGGLLSLSLLHRNRLVLNVHLHSGWA